MSGSPGAVPGPACVRPTYVFAGLTIPTGPSGARFRADAFRALGRFDDFGAASDYRFWLRACAHVNVALRYGADLRFRQRVLGWRAAHDGVSVETEAGTEEADRLVICAGAWARALVHSLQELAVPERQVVAWLQPTRPELFAPEAFPVFLLDFEEGSFYGFPVHDIPGFKI